MKKQRTKVAPPRRRPVNAAQVATPLEVVKPQPDRRLLLTRDICARIPGNNSDKRISVVTLWRWVKTGRFPQPRVIGGRNGWIEQDYLDWLDNPRRRQYRDSIAEAV